MFSKNMQAIYGRLLILGLLTMCFVVFGYTNAIEKVSAATSLCTQDCDDNLARCNDACSTSCSADSTDEACSSCLGSCEDNWLDCYSVARICSKPLSYNPQCTVGYADHCSINPDGTTNCENAHSGYYEVCNNIGGQQCVSCPSHEYCEGSNGLPPCF